MNARRFTSSIVSGMLAVCVALALLASSLAGQSTSPALQLLARESRRSMPIVLSGTQEMVALDDLAAAFQLTVRDDGGAITVAYKGRSVVLTPDQTIASVAGRLISLPAAPVRTGGRWLVPLDFVSRALAPIYDQRLELRRASHLLVIGDVRVPRVTIRHEALGLSARVTLEVVPSTAVAVTQQGQRLLLRFDADALDTTMPVFQPTGFVQAVRAPDATNLIVDLGPRFATFRSTTTPSSGGTRVTIDVFGTTDVPPAPSPAPAPPPDLPMPPAQPALTQSAPGLRTVVLDAGHGGDDAGARGVAGTLEKDLTLTIARRLKGLLEARLGLRVVMTRDDDRFLTVENRSATANNNKADLLLSLHANASFRPEVSGTAVYLASFSDADLALEGQTPERLPVFGGGLRTIEVVPWSLAQIPHRAQSERFAQALVESLTGTLPLAARPLEHAPLRVLESANMPAALVELGYLTNADQEAALADADLQAKVAQALLDAIQRFRDALATPVEGPVR